MSGPDDVPTDVLISTNSQGRAGWLVERRIDPAWCRVQGWNEPRTGAEVARVAVRRRSLLVGRVSHHRAIRPDIDCEPDEGVSRRHAQLYTDGTRWWIEDLRSENGTFVAAAGAPLPTRPITPGARVLLRPGDRVYLGAGTCLTVLRASHPE